MSDTILQENDDNEEFNVVEIDALPDGSPHQSEPLAEEPVEDEPSAEDAKLADSEDDDDDDETEVSDDASPNKKKRAKRRELQKIAKAATLRELEILREQNEKLTARLSAVEKDTFKRTETDLERQIRETQEDILQAEQFIANALESGNGDQAVRAMRLRDEANARVAELAQTKSKLAETQVEHEKQVSAPPQNPRATSLALEWINQNSSWYNPNGTDTYSNIARQIDKQIGSEGYDPATPEYYVELTSRLNSQFRSAAEPEQKSQTTPTRKAPPMGNTREHAPTSTKKDVYVTPERKQAMIEAGLWNDPVKREQALKAYSDYDNQSAR